MCQRFLSLLSLSLDLPDDKEIKENLTNITTYLAKQFKNYLIMAVGGEIRHFKRETRFNSCATYIKIMKEKYGQSWDCWAQHPNCKGCGKDNLSNPLLSSFLPKEIVNSDVLQYILDIKEENHCYSRVEVWASWYEIYHTHKLEALKVLEYLFKNIEWRDNFGGSKWANVTDVLISYLSGGMSDLLFVDTAWSLQHNNSIIFDKIWDITGVRIVLDANFRHQMWLVKVKASDNIKELYDRKTLAIKYKDNQ